eukprot:TRINITY_DN44790_c0_g1_i1.p1 TRINITY_DN44790_c0_g1~~TRINITY_DN44790_c0_g1_i1.p1  ORF type:complete len:182 (+),score=22.09 TRINITY_DN44790_c0_g1_i1:96-641(+)
MLRRFALLAPPRRWFAEGALDDRLFANHRPGICFADATLWRRRHATNIVELEHGADGANTRVTSTALNLADAEEVRTVSRHPQMVSLEIKTHSGEATLRHRQVVIRMPLAEFKDRLREWGWQASNSQRPVLLFGDNSDRVRAAHEFLVEEGFTSVCNADCRDAVAAAFRRQPRHVKPAGEQ